MTPQRRRLIVIILLFLVGAWRAEQALPLMEGGDEWLQLAYVEHLRTTGTLPDRDAALTSPIRQQAGQPPLTYVVSAFPGAVARLPAIDTSKMWADLQRDSNNWFAPPDRFNRTDNNNVFYLSNAPANEPATRLIARASRLMIPLWGVVGIFAAYAAAWEVFREPRPALAAAALFAFTPTYLHINTFPNTDSGAAALATVVLWLALWGVRHGVSGTWAAAGGLVLGLAGLAKVSAVLIAPALIVGGVLGLRGRVDRSSQIFRDALRLALIGAVPVALTFGAWVLWGALIYGDPFGTGTHRFEGQFFDPPLGPLAVLSRMPEVYLSYWGKFASAVYLHPATYAVLSLIPVTAVVGWRVGLRRGRPPAVYLVLWAGVLFPAAGLYYWLATINFITGRLLFPAHAALCILLVAGLRSLRWGAAGRMLAISVPMLAALVLTPNALRAAYREPLPPPGNLTLNETVYDFEGSIRLIGWSVDDIVMVNGNLATFTLCWEVLAPPSRPAAYALRAVKDGVPIGERTTVHGTGRYDWRLWESGRRFCDRLDMPIDGAVPDERYDLLLVLLDAETGAVDWMARTLDGTPVQFPVLGQVVGGASDSSQ